MAKCSSDSPRGEPEPGAPSSGTPRESQAKFRDGYCRRVLWVPGLAGQYSGKIRFIEKPGVQDEGGRHVVKRSSDPRVAHPDVKVQVRDLVRVVGIVAPFAPMGASTRGKFVLSSPRGEMGTWDLSWVPIGPFCNTHTVPFLTFACLSYSILLLGAPGTGRLRPSTLWSSIKPIFPEYWSPARHRGQQYP